MAVSETSPQQQSPSPSPPAPKPGAEVALQERRLFNFYRPEEGHASRAVCGLTFGALFLWGAFSFFDWLPPSWKEPLRGTADLLGSEFVVSWGLIASAALGLALLYGIFWFINYPKWVDFLVETEAEMKKVSWASKRQVVTESIVVIATIVILGTFIFSVDTVLYWIKHLPWDNLWDKLF